MPPCDLHYGLRLDVEKIHLRSTAWILRTSLLYYCSLPMLATYNIPSADLTVCRLKCKHSVQHARSCSYFLEPTIFVAVQARKAM